MQSTAGYKIVQLANGVHSVHSLAHRETFHPVIGPVAEAEALYVKQLRLPERMTGNAGEFIIWDVGLGAAANVLTVLRATRSVSCPVRILSFDHTLEPLQFALDNAATLGYFTGYESAAEDLVKSHRATFTDTNRSVTWELRLGDFPSLLTHRLAGAPAHGFHGPDDMECGYLRPQLAGVGGAAAAGDSRAPGGGRRLIGSDHGARIGESLPAPHAILFDAFSPARNPAMWTQPLFANLFRFLDPARPCALPTYSRSTMLRVSLLLAGFFVGAGHATGEKEETTIAANTPELISEPLDRTWLQRARNSTSAEPLWEPVYRQAPLSPGTWEKLRAHPQFK